MVIYLKRIELDDAKQLWEMQVKAFRDIYEKYRDTETSPAIEEIDKVVMRLNQWFTYYYFIVLRGEIVGAVRVADKKGEEKPKRISPIFVMPEHRNTEKNKQVCNHSNGNQLSVEAIRMKLVNDVIEVIEMVLL